MGWLRPLCGLLLVAVLLCKATKASWQHVRLDSNSWTAVRKMGPDEFWVKPQSRLLTSEKRGCNNDWLVTVQLWSWDFLSRVQKALQKSGSCFNASCVVAPFHVARIELHDQSGQWVSDEVRFINGPLPSAVNFQLRHKGPGANCSFKTSSLFVQTYRNWEASAISGYDVRRAFFALQRLHPNMSVQAAARRLATTLLQQRQTPQIMSSEAVRRLRGALIDWAILQRNKKILSGSQNGFGGDGVVFGRFPLFDKLQTGDMVTEVLRFSLLPQIEEPKRQPLPKSDLEKLKSRIMDLENTLKNLSCVPQIPCIAPNNQSHTSTRPPVGIKMIDSCYKAGEGIFFLKSVQRYVRCSTSGELLVLHRQVGNINFNRSFEEYRRGFGDARKGDYWLGLDFLANHTAKGDMCARITLKPWLVQLTESSIQYANFEVGSRANGYRLWYTKSTSKGVSDALLENRGRAFSTYDRDLDAFIGNCAKMFGGGGWYNSCSRANIFGKIDVLSSRCMCWRGVPSQGDMCVPLTGISLAVREASQGAGSSKVVFKSMENGDEINPSPITRHRQPITSSPWQSGGYTTLRIYDNQEATTQTPIWQFNLPACKPTRHLVYINGTGRYTLTAAGAPGGRSKDRPGGRGALARTRLVIKAGTMLAVVAGCPGSEGYIGGHGGDASWIIDMSSRSLLLVAGGGGGAGGRTKGGHGTLHSSGGAANEVYSNNALTFARILRKDNKSRGLGWSEIGQRLMFGNWGLSSGAKSRTRKRVMRGYRYDIFDYVYENADVLGGGGGGGYEGGVSGSDIYSGGGGGGSFCKKNSTDSSCDITAGGNMYNTGYVYIEKQTCF